MGNKGPLWAGIDVGKSEAFVVIRESTAAFERPWKVKLPSEIRELVSELQTLQSRRGVSVEATGTYGEALRQTLTDGKLDVRRVRGQATSDYAEIFDGVPSQHDGKDAAMLALLSSVRGTLGVRMTVITKRGPSIVRRWLFFSALPLVQQGPLRPWFEAKKKKDKDRGLGGVVAVMRKLALAVHATVINDEPFRLDWLMPGKSIRRPPKEQPQPIEQNRKDFGRPDSDVQCALNKTITPQTGKTSSSAPTARRAPKSTRSALTGSPIQT